MADPTLRVSAGSESAGVSRPRRSGRPGRSRWQPVSLVMLVLGLNLSMTPSAQAADDTASACDPAAVTDRVADTKDEESLALRRMHVPQAQALTKGRGITVAVVDSGVAAVGGLRVVQGAIPGVKPSIVSGHGTIVAGLIASDVGVAPDADILSVKVLDSDDGADGNKAVDSAGIAAGLNALADRHSQFPFQVVNISLGVPEDPVLAQAIRRIQALDVVVVAASGNRSEAAGDGFKGTDDSDAPIYPADYPGVVAVNVAVPDYDPEAMAAPAESLLPNRQTTVSAPTWRALSYNATGAKCWVSMVSTSMAAAEVAGVVALLRARFPDYNAAQIISRLTLTAEGSAGDDPQPFSGAGLVQAHDALTRKLDLDTQGNQIGRSVAEPRADAQAPAPLPEVDTDGPSQRMLLWVAVSAAAALVLGLVLRPLVGGRRTK